jgi:hypothetical protein
MYDVKFRRGKRRSESLEEEEGDKEGEGGVQV